MSAVNHRLPFMLSFYQNQRPDGTHVQRYINDKSEKLLKVLGETLLKDTAWNIHSHGAWARAETDRHALFERLILVLPRPEQHSPKLFQPWAEGRLRYLARYMEQTNSGRVVRYVVQKQVVIAIMMRRKGYDLQDPTTPLPPPEKIPNLIKLFCREIHMYINWMEDPEMSFVQALKMTVIPQDPNPPIHKFSLDLLPTAIGLRGKSIPLNPVTLVRGVIAEIAEQLDLRVDEAPSDELGRIGQMLERLQRRRQRLLTEACVRELDHLSAKIDLIQPDFNQLYTWVQEFDIGRAPALIPLRLLIAIILMIVVALSVVAKVL